MARPPKPRPESPAKDDRGRVCRDYVYLRLRGTITVADRQIGRKSGRRYMRLTVRTLAKSQGAWHETFHEVFLFGTLAHKWWPGLTSQVRVQIEGRTTNRRSRQLDGYEVDKYCVVAIKLKYLGRVQVPPRKDRLPKKRD